MSWNELETLNNYIIIPGNNVQMLPKKYDYNLPHDGAWRTIGHNSSSFGAILLKLSEDI